MGSGDGGGGGLFHPEFYESSVKVYRWRIPEVFTW